MSPLRQKRPFHNRLKAAFDELPRRREHIPAFVDASMVVAAQGGSEEVSRLIEKHPFRPAVEPLAGALKIKRGERPLAAKEVLEVARDIAGQAGSPRRHTAEGSAKRREVCLTRKC